jgi:hypothetical protein
MNRVEGNIAYYEGRLYPFIRDTTAESFLKAALEDKDFPTNYISFTQDEWDLRKENTSEQVQKQEEGR